jgi:hypothetical protein
MFQKELSALALGLVLAACAATPADLPAGAGLLAADLEAPSGAAVFQRPDRRTGDWFDYRRGGLLRLRYLVQQTQDELQLMDPDSGRVLVFDQELAQLGERSPAGQGWSTQLDPLDPGYSWPLWVGKRWSGSFTRRGADGIQVPMLVHYECDALEQVQTPAGTFLALRIWRRASPRLEGDYIDRATISWYAPEVGHLVRRVDNGIVTELEAFYRQ